MEFFKRKRGSAAIDTLFIIIILFVFALVGGIFGYQALDSMNTQIMPELTHNASQQTMTDLHTEYPSYMDAAFLLAFFLIWGMTIVASFMLDTHPIFFIFTMILLIFVVIVGMIIANTYEEIIEDPEIESSASEFPMTNFIFGNFLIIILVVAFSIGLVLFGKFKLAGGVG